MLQGKVSKESTKSRIWNPTPRSSALLLLSSGGADTCMSFVDDNELRAYALEVRRPFLPLYVVEANNAKGMLLEKACSQAQTFFEPACRGTCHPNCID
jgi:hypothetical protein